MSEHTPEPWQVFEGEEIDGVLCPDGKHILDMWHRGGQGRSNARRIVDCVNACAGIPTASLEGKPGAVLEIGVSNLEAERDQLKARIAELEAELDKLQDPAAVWANIIQGKIARPQALDHYEECKATVERLEAELARRDQQWCPTSIACSVERDKLREDIEKFKANNRYQRGYHDGQIEAREKQSACIKEMREALAHACRILEYDCDLPVIASVFRAVLESWPQ